MRPIELFWMASLGTLVALPARPSTVDVMDRLSGAESQDPTPYQVALEAQGLPGAFVATNTPGPEFMAAQIALIVVGVVALLRNAPPASTVVAWCRQAALAALARSRTRSIIARNPFDL